MTRSALLSIISFLFLFTSCIRPDDNEEGRNKLLDKLTDQAIAIQKKIDELDEVEKGQNAAKEEIDQMIKALRKQKKEVKKEAESLKKASKKELKKAIREANSKYEKWMKTMEKTY